MLFRVQSSLKKNQPLVESIISFVNIAESSFPKGLFAVVAKAINIRY